MLDRATPGINPAAGDPNPRRAALDTHRRSNDSEPAADDARRGVYICSGAEMPSSARALAIVVRVADASARRPVDSSGAAGSTTRASR